MKKLVPLMLTLGLAAACCLPTVLIGRDLCRDGTVVQAVSPDARYIASVQSNGCYMSPIVDTSVHIAPTHQDGLPSPQS